MATPKLSKAFKQFLESQEMDGEVEWEEHPGCWDKGCSHGEYGITVWFKDNETYKWSFATMNEAYVRERIVINIMSERKNHGLKPPRILTKKDL